MWCILRLKQVVPGGVWSAGILLICLLNLGSVDWLSMQPRSAQEALSEDAGVADYFGNYPGLYRIYSPSYSLPQQTAALHGLQLADGIDPLQITSYVAFMGTASGVPAQGYSVTLPPYRNGDPAEDNRDYRPDPTALGLLNVRFVVAAYDLSVDNLVLRAQIGQTRIYENLAALPRAWLQPPGSLLGQDVRDVEISSYAPDRITVRASGPGLLVLSEVAYPGWQVSVDGRPAHIQTVAGVLRGVELTVGEHSVEFVFRPWSVYVGLGLGMLAWAGWIINNLYLGGKKRYG